MVNRFTGDTVTAIEIDVTVEYGGHHGCRGATDRYGAPIEPDDPGEITDLAIKIVSGGKSIDIADYLPDEIIEYIEQIVWADQS